jgi:hypothetical protein
MITSYKEERLYYQLFTGQFVISSYKEEGIHYQLFTGQFVITAYKEEGLHYHLFTVQFVNHTSTLLQVTLDGHTILEYNTFS